ncbi:hypothetical protein Daus18300_010867 [Diaporthe australafricana]|uniref:DNA (cytosine-5-)-methyltransferase n=1 Tax=Diaporthe australafricana TaxID=127596 RepID=A0ABR3W8K4_9PEZI
MAPTFVDLFCGIGGFRIGLEAAGFECVYANDIDSQAVKVYQINRHADADYPVVCADIRDVFHNNLDQIPSHHLLAAGFPCNSYSLAGNNKGDDDPEYGDLGSYVVKIAEAKRPVLVLLENVPGFFTTLRGWYKKLKARFEVAGYRCSYDLLTAPAFNLPQARKRGFIVAVREDIHPVPFTFPPAPEEKKVALRGFLLPAGSEDLRGQMMVKARDFPMLWATKNWPNKPALEDVVDTVRDDQRTNQYSGLILLGWRKGLKKRSYSRVYHDLGHLPTVMTNGSQDAWFLTPGAEGEGPVVRRTHLKEMRRVQGFPDSFILDGSKTDAKKQLGHAVPPPMVRYLGLLLMEKFGYALLDDAVIAPNSSGSRSSSQRKERSASRKNGLKREWRLEPQERAFLKSEEWTLSKPEERTFIEPEERTFIESEERTLLKPGQGAFIQVSASAAS